MKAIPNFRDLGGLDTLNGRKMRKGLIFRSGNFDRMSEKDVRNFFPPGFRVIIDLRTSKESAKTRRAVAGAKEINLPMEVEHTYRTMVRPNLYKKGVQGLIVGAVSSIYAGWLLSQKQIIGTLFEILRTQDSYPVLIHCRAGQDRTGFMCALVHLALGADPAAIIRDYLLSNSYTMSRVRGIALFMKLVSLGFLCTANFVPAFTAHEQYLRSVFAAISNSFGGVERYLASCGISAGHLADFRDLVLE
ncbi:MAG TPA: tyrosine-protein phosphatase [Chitinivibrionales bacterium]|nr:tyrosine-protein phosphatase [Chitinivibrionales bacterium]